MPFCAICSDSLGAARDRHFLGIAAELVRQAPAHHFDVPLDQAAVIDRRLVRVIEIALYASCTTVGLGQLLPLFRLINDRSSVNAFWMSRQ
ncbi:MAG: hypothetical protein WKG07_46155 [Hymenobacter sp.]